LDLIKREKTKFINYIDYIKTIDQLVEFVIHRWLRIWSRVSL